MPGWSASTPPDVHPRGRPAAPRRCRPRPAKPHPGRCRPARPAAGPSLHLPIRRRTRKHRRRHRRAPGHPRLQQPRRQPRCRGRTRRRPAPVPLNLLREADASVKAGQWDREGHRGTEISGRTIGILGYGHMGSAFAEKLHRLWMPHPRLRSLPRRPRRRPRWPRGGRRPDDAPARGRHPEPALQPDPGNPRSGRPGIPVRVRPAHRAAEHRSRSPWSAPQTCWTP